MKKLSSSSVRNAEFKLDPFDTRVDVVFEVTSGDADRKLVNKSESGDGVKLVASSTDVSENFGKI